MSLNSTKIWQLKSGIAASGPQGLKISLMRLIKEESDTFVGQTCMEEKTNVMRILDQKKISYTAHTYDNSKAISGTEVAAYLNQNPDRVFKTLVTVAKSGKNYVFVIPVEEELDLKKAAKAVGEKSIDMLKSKDLLPLTGYIHGGCSPIGMKKLFPTTFQKEAEEYNTIMFSAGKIGYQVEMNLKDLAKVIPYKTADITNDNI